MSNNFLNTVAKTIGIGISMATLVTLFMKTIQKLPFQEVSFDDNIKNKVDELSPNDRRLIYIVILPVMDECLFRGLIQPIFTKIINRIAPNLITHGPIVNPIASLATNILFGLLYLSGIKTGKPIRFIAAFSTGIVLSQVKEKYGFLGGLLSHMSFNIVILDVFNRLFSKPHLPAKIALFQKD